MFGHKEEHRRRGGFLPFVIFRLALSLIIMMVFALGIYQAFRYFSGVDPGKVDPKTLIVSLVSSSDSTKFLTAFLNFKLPSNISNLKSITEDPSQALNSTRVRDPGERILRFAVVADSHNDNTNLRKALSQAKAEGSKFVVGLGDYTDVGTVRELQAAKNVFESAELPYYLTVGDHDLWSARDKKLDPLSFFSQVFGPSYQSFGDSNIRFVIVNNGDDYLGVSQEQMSWLEGELQKIIENKPKQTFIFISEPLYHPSSDHVMGKTDSKLKGQASMIINDLKDASIGEILAGDTHFYSRYQDPTSKLHMTAVGAITEERNAQKPRFLLVDVYSDGSYNIQDTEIK